MEFSRTMQVRKRTSPHFPVYWSKPMLQYLLKFQEKHGDFPTESEKCVLVVDLEKSYPEAAPFSWKTIDFELTNLRTGPQHNLWTREMKARLISELCFESKAGPSTLPTIYHTLRVNYQCDIEYDEAYRMLQQLKLDDRIAFDWDIRRWYIPEIPAGRAPSG